MTTLHGAGEKGRRKVRWLVKPMFVNGELEYIAVLEVDKGLITCAFGIATTEPIEEIGYRNMCGGTIAEPQTWQPITYEIFNSLGGNMNNQEIHLVEKGYIGRALSYPQKKELPEGYCKFCAEEDNLWDRPIIGIDKKLYCNKCLRPFIPIPFKYRD